MNTGHRATVMVDWDFFSYFPNVRRWVHDNAENASFILLVSDPVHHDYSPPAAGAGAGATELFDSVIRNSGNQPDLSFKRHAVQVIKDMSTYEPVLALDPDFVVQAMYLSEGLLHALGSDELG